MSNWAALDVAIGLVVVYFVLSLLCSTLNEAIASALGWRAKFLERWLLNIFTEPEAKEKDMSRAEEEAKKLVAEFYAHPLIRPLMNQPRWWTTKTTRERKPSYIATEIFSAVLLNFAPATTYAKRTLDEIVKDLPSAELRKKVTALQQEAGNDPDQLRARIERWYDDAMERVSGWYKRRVQLALAAIGLSVAIILNADSLQIVRTLWSDKTIRAAVVAEAGRTQAGPPAQLKDVANEVQKIKALNVPLGWKLKTGDPRDLPHGTSPWAAKVIGILLTTLALMLGAPFWFDLLSKLVRVRGSGAPPPARDTVRSGEGEQRRAGVGASL